MALWDIPECASDHRKKSPNCCLCQVPLELAACLAGLSWKIIGQRVLCLRRKVGRTGRFPQAVYFFVLLAVQKYVPNARSNLKGTVGYAGSGAEFGLMEGTAHGITIIREITRMNNISI